MDATRVGEHLAALRKQRGMTQQDAADCLGVSNKTISKWENGGGLPDISVLPALAELYGVTADEILAGEALDKPSRGDSSDSEVKKYLHRRETFRYRFGTAAAILCLTAGMLCYFHSYRRIWVWLLLLCGYLALWLSWSHAGTKALHGRMQMLFPVLSVQLYVILDHWLMWIGYGASWLCSGGELPADWMEFRAFWALLLILLPLLYVALSRILRSRESDAALYPRSCFVTLVIGWCTAAELYVYRWVMEMPGIREYLAAHHYYQSKNEREWLYQYPLLDLMFPAILIVTFTVFLLLLLYHRARENHAPKT